MAQKKTYHHSTLLMTFSVLLLTGFLAYFVSNAYSNEKARIAKEVGYLFINAVKNVEGSLFNKLVFDQVGPQTLEHSEVKIKIVNQDGKLDTDTERRPIVRTDSVRKLVRISATSTDGDNLKDVSGVISMIVDLKHDSTNALKIQDRKQKYFPLIETQFRQNLQKAGITAAYTIGRDTSTTTNSDNFTASYSDIGTKDKFYVQLDDNVGLILKQIWPQILLSLLLLSTILLSFASVLRYSRKQRELMGMKNDFIQNMTHELKTPVSTVSIALEAIQNFKASESEAMKSEYIGIARNEIAKLGAVVERVLSISQMTDHPTAEGAVEIELPALFEAVAESLQFTAKQFGVTLIAEPAQQEFKFSNHRQNLSIVLFNLVENAIKYARNESPLVQLRWKRMGDVVEIQVIDNGTPIPEALHQKIFEKFYRMPEGSVHDIKGHGLGLHIVQQLVTNMKGKISVSSDQQGNTFTLQFPLNP